MDLSARTPPPTRPYWQARREQEVRRAQLEAEIELRRLEGERKLHAGEQVRVDAGLILLNEPEPRLRVHALLALRWGGLCMLTLFLMVVGTWWSVSWYQTLGWEKGFFAISLCVLPLIGGTTFLMRARQRSDEQDFRKLLCALGLVIVLSSVAAGALLGLGRMAGVTQSEERHAAGQIPEDLDAPAQRAGNAPGIAKTKWLLGLAGFGAVILMTIAADIASAITFEEFVNRATVVWTVRHFYKRADKLRELLVENAWRMEEVRRSPELLYIRLTIAGLNQEETASREAAEAERKAKDQARLADEHDRYRDSLEFLIKRVVLFFGIALAIILGVAALALATESKPAVTVVLFDLSQSTESAEFARNLRAVEGIILRVSGNSRLVILGITEASFSTAPLLAESSPRTAGQFGEYLDDWRHGAILRWRKVASTLSPAASGSDLFGAVARASREFDGTSGTVKRLVVLSDMRHVGRGFNFERVMGDPLFVMESVRRQELVPRLEGVKVWVLGAHTVGIDERQWDRLKRFWTEYLGRAGPSSERSRR